jgi:hypothetical protein
LRLQSCRASFDFAQDEGAFVYGIYQQKMPEQVYLVLSVVEGRAIVVQRV